MAGINLPSFPTTGSDVSDLAPWDPIENVISGKPSHTIYVASEDPGGKFITKMYECSPGKFPVEPYFIDCYELAHILTGKLIVTDSDGNTQTYEAGDVFITPQGFTGTWEIVETMRKVFAIRHD